MKFSYSWLKQLVDINLPAPKLAEFLSSHAFETEVATKEQKFENIIVARVVKIDKHPNADRLRVIELTDGDKTIAPVVCGAWNFDVGAKVPLALAGATIPHNQHDPEGKPFTLNKATIRGIESQGMICSARELGLEDEGPGILLLNSDYEVGEEFAVKSNTNDVLFDISIPANRPDLLSYRGVAWEIAALTGKKYLAKSIKSNVSKSKTKGLNVRISEPKLCKKYLAARLSSVKVGPSPKFIQERLQSSGLRPINNVVDITNYVMLEVGQPLHAFDATKVVGGLNIRKAYMQESLETLDGVKRKLSAEMLVIADAKNVLAVAGVIGGMHSAINENTEDIILESANFNAVSVRKTAKSLGIRTDASSRFEKSLPPAFTILALEYAIELLQKYAGAKVLDFAEAGAKQEKENVIKYDPTQTNFLAGAEISAAEQKKILEKFGFTVRAAKNKFDVIVPFWRPDVSIWQDLTEEIIRFKGLDYISPKKMQFPNTSGMTDREVELQDKIADLLVGMGFDETYTYAFVSESIFKKYGLDSTSAVELANPISADLKYMRLGLGMNYDKIAEQNMRFVSEQNVFEIGNVYHNHKGNIDEHTNLFLMSYSSAKQTVPKLVGCIRELFKRLGIKADIKQIDEESGEVYANKDKVGHIRAAKDEFFWSAAELDLEKIIDNIKRVQYNLIPKYPSKELDVALLVNKDLAWSQIKQAITHKLIASVELFDVYQGSGVSPDKKSLGFRIIYQSADKTLTDDEVQKIHKQILENLKTKFHAQIRE